MRFTKEFPLFLGWLFSFVIAAALTFVFLLPFRGKDFTVQSEFVSFIVPVIVFYLLVAFFMFMVSIRNIVIPLYQKNKIVSAEFRQLKLPAYLSHWFLWWVCSVLYCLPLICWDSLIAIVPTPPVEKVIRFLWQLVASYFAYRLVIKQWIEKATIDNRLENEKQIPAA
jgi:hypothetical protein